MVWQNTSNEAILIIEMYMEPGEKKQTVQLDTKLNNKHLFPHMLKLYINELKQPRMSSSENHTIVSKTQSI